MSCKLIKPTFQCSETMAWMSKCTYGNINIHIVSYDKHLKVMTSLESNLFVYFMPSVFQTIYHETVRWYVPDELEMWKETVVV